MSKAKQTNRKTTGEPKETKRNTKGKQFYKGKPKGIQRKTQSKITGKSEVGKGKAVENPRTAKEEHEGKPCQKQSKPKDIQRNTKGNPKGQPRNNNGKRQENQRKREIKGKAKG